MARNPRRIDADLDALYEQVPQIACRGLCSDSCGPIEMSARERQRLEAAAGPVSCADHCSVLKDGRCSAYELRPMICRLWGVADQMPCPHGCRPVSPLPDAEARILLRRADDIGGVAPGRTERLLQGIAGALGRS